MGTISQPGSGERWQDNVHKLKGSGQETLGLGPTAFPGNSDHEWLPHFCWPSGHTRHLVLHQQQ